MKKIKFLAIMLMAGITIVSCGKKEEKKEKEVTEEPMETMAPSNAELSNVLELEANDQMKFNHSELRAVAGKPIKLTLKNVGKNPKDQMGHNCIILKQGTDINAFTQKAMTEKATDYIPSSEKGSIIAHTKLVGPGEQDTVEFTINEKGTYDFMCSFPAHSSAQMRCKLIIQ